MKRYWHTWLAILASACFVNSTDAQHNWSHPSEIGSYQSIVSRAGMGEGAVHAPPTQSVSGWHHEGAPDIPNQPQPPAPPDLTPGSIGGGSAHNQGFVSGAGGGAGSWGAGNCGTGGCGAGHTEYFDVGGRGAENAANWVVGTRALFFNRSREAGIPLTRNATDALWSTDNAYGTLPGAEISMIRRTCQGNGLELRYWGLIPSERETTIFGPGLDTYLVGFGDYLIGPGPNNLQDYYNNADSNRIYRNNEFHNVEVNALRNGGSYTTRGGRTGNFELLGGFRWLYFNEDFRYSAFNAGAVPTRVNYDLAARNNLLGFQLGGRNEVCLTDRISLVSGTRFGLFNNNIRSRQSISNEFGVFASPAGGAPGVDDYNYSSRKNELAALGELEAGVAYQFAQRARLNVGYRVLGISGVALAPSQIPRNFSNPAEINRINSKDSLILGGAYAGMDFCF